MRLDCPDRPKMNNAPALVHRGKPLCVIPRIQLTLQLSGTIMSFVIVPLAFNAYHYKHKELANTQELAQLVGAFAEDPERTLREWYNWTYDDTPPAPVPIPAPAADGPFKASDFLKDLGL